MNTPTPSHDAERGTASGHREPFSGPSSARATDARLHDVDLEARGEFVDDHQRDRHSKGVADGYDDSVDHRRGGDDRLGIARGD